MPQVRRDNLSIYVPTEKQKEKPIERLQKLAKQKDRSANYLVVRAILVSGRGRREKVVREARFPPAVAD